MDIQALAKRGQAIIQIVAALGLIWTGVLFMSEHPYITNRIAKMAGTERLSQELDDNNKVLAEVLEKVLTLETGENYSAAPVMTFTVDGNEISDGGPGQLVVFDISYIQLRNCGRPFIIAAFRNGNNIIHTFEDLSVVDVNGRGLTSPVSDGQILHRRFTARIPADEGVKDGDATAWLEFGPFPSCQNAATIYSPRMPFRVRTIEEVELEPRPSNNERN
jgi:hypothetical protein